MADYNKITPRVVSYLKDLVGPENVIYDDQEKMEPYSHDETFERGYASMPDIIVKPSSAEQISRILQLANEELVPVTPRGAGSGLSGGAVPVYGGILLSLERMNKILEIDKENLMITVEPGVITNEISRKLREDNLFYAGYPLSLETCFIGGNVAENAGGAKAIKYGVTGQYVQGLEVVLPTGEIINLGGKRLKDVTGYDLIHLVVGSEGTLGIFTKIVLRLLPLPRESVSLLVPFKTLEAAVRTAPNMMIDSGIIPSAIELIDKKCIDISCRLLNEKVPFQEEAESFLLIEVDGNPQQVEEEYNKLADYCLESEALDVYVANTPSTRERFWSIRRSISDGLKAYHPENIAEDIVVPPASIPQLLNKAYELCGDKNLECLSFGHLGDGNVHIHILRNEKMSYEGWLESTEKVLQELYPIAREMGGTLSGEHGIGHKRKKYLPLVLGETELQLMKRIKDAFDPNHILNPGKII